MTVDHQGQRVAIITGAGSGVGAAISLRLGMRGDWKIVLAGRTISKLETVAEQIRKTGGTALAVTCDVTKAAEVERLVDAAGSTLDALIHSAGKGHCFSIYDLDEKEWRETLDVMVTGAFLTAKAALPKMRATKNGCGYIMQICSLASGGTWNMEVGYGTVKAAQLKFALHLAEQMKLDAASGGRIIYSHAICPGTVNTPFWDAIPQRPIKNPGLVLTADEVAWLVEQVINNPAVTAEELAPLVPRKEVVVKRHPPFERWPNVIAIAHRSHP
jgi:NAD(P)-dependent dehydrogenase (short-subunit alcohol dehydrogenase family)